MHPIVLVAIVAVAAGALGVGFLSNTISLNVQTIGVGEQELEALFDEANVDFKIGTILFDPDKPACNSVTDDCTNADPTKNYLLNVIKACSFSLPDNGPSIASSSTLLCKLTDINGNVLAEGKLLSGTWEYNPANPGEVLIPIDERFYNNNLIFDQNCFSTSTTNPLSLTDCILFFPNSNDVQLVHDVRIVFLGVAPSEFPP